MKLINFFLDSYILAGHALSVALHKLGICLEELSLDKQAEIMFLSQGY